ncbi:MAG: glycerol-3-phosphate cytidylyltransferase [Pseudomonadota bacterium]
MKTAITYGTFDLLHYGHIALLQRTKALTQGGRLIVGLSTDEFNTLKGKKTYMPYEKRKQLIEAIRYVDLVIPEENWEQKKHNIKKYDVDIFVIGDDWTGKFDELKEFCDVIYLQRTALISSTVIKEIITESQSNYPSKNINASNNG